MTNLGGLVLPLALLRRLDAARVLDERVVVLKMHLPYHESDHVLSQALDDGECVALRLRHGNMRSSDGAADLLDEELPRLLQHYETVLVVADSDYDRFDLRYACERHQCYYAFVGRETENRPEAAESCENWRPFRTRAHRREQDRRKREADSFEPRRQGFAWWPVSSRDGAENSASGSSSGALAVVAVADGSLVFEKRPVGVDVGSVGGVPGGPPGVTGVPAAVGVAGELGSMTCAKPGVVPFDRTLLEVLLGAQTGDIEGDIASGRERKDAGRSLERLG